MSLPSGYFAQLALNGQCYIGSATVAGVDLPISTSLSPTFAIWNPSGSGVNLVLNSFSVNVIDVTTPLLTSMILSYVPNTGGAIGTGAPVATFTGTSPLNAKIAAGPAAQARFSLSCTLTAAGTAFYALGYSRESATVAVGNQVFTHFFNGDLIIPQGVLVHACGIAAFTTNLMPTITWAEVPAS